jgi:hypothetical protein
LNSLDRHASRAGKIWIQLVTNHMFSITIASQDDGGQGKSCAHHPESYWDRGKLITWWGIHRRACAKWRPNTPYVIVQERYIVVPVCSIKLDWSDYFGAVVHNFCSSCFESKCNWLCRSLFWVLLLKDVLWRIRTAYLEIHGFSTHWFGLGRDIRFMDICEALHASRNYGRILNRSLNKAWDNILADCKHKTITLFLRIHVMMCEWLSSAFSTECLIA